MPTPLILFDLGILMFKKILINSALTDHLRTNVSLLVTSRQHCTDSNHMTEALTIFLFMYVLIILTSLSS